MNLAASEPSRQTPSAETRSVGDFLAEVLARHEILSLSIILLVVLVAAVVGSRAKPLWYDEIFSIIVAMQPTWHRFALAMPADGNPPLYPLLTRALTHLFGYSALVVRVPALTGFLAALTGVYIFVRRECGAVFGLLAVVLTVAEPGWTYAFEARPYTLMLAFMMLALVNWQAAARAADAIPARSRRGALAGIVVGIAGAMLSHHMGMVEVGVPLLFGEGVRSWRRRRLDWPVLATALVAAPTLAFTLPMAHRTSALLLNDTREWRSHLGFVQLIEAAIANAKVSLPLIVSHELLIILLLTVFVCWRPSFLARRRRALAAATTGQVPVHFVAAALGAALLVPVTCLVMMFSTGYYNSRYGIGSIAGIAMLACLLLVRLGRRQGNLLLILILFFAWPNLHKLFSDIHHPQVAHPLAYVDPLGLPVVVSGPFAFVPAWWYAPPSVKPKIVYLVDPVAALRRGDTVVDVALVAERPVISASIEDPPAFLATHDHFLLHLAGGSPDFAFLEQLKSEGFHVSAVAGTGDRYFYYDVRKDGPGLH